MSTYGPPGPGQEPPADPWTDETIPVQPASPSPQLYPPVTPALPTTPLQPAPPMPASFEPGHAAPAPPYNQYQQPQYQPNQWATPNAQPVQPNQYQQDQYQPNQYHQGYEQPGPPLGNYDEQVWQAPRQKSNTAVIVLSMLLTLVVVVGLGVGGYLYLRGDKNTPAAVIPAAGQCVQSNGEPEPNTTVSVATCGVSSFKVLKTIQGTDQTASCNGVAGLTNVFHFTASGDISKSYVLCLGPGA